MSGRSRQRDRKSLARARRDAELADLREGRRRRAAVFMTERDYKRKQKNRSRDWRDET